MARHKNYPSYLDWQDVVEAALLLAMKETTRVAYRVNGAATRLQVAIKDPSIKQSSQPFVCAYLTNIVDGWDDERSGQENYEGAGNITNIGDNKTVHSRNAIMERLVFEIMSKSQSYDQAIDIQNAIRKYFGKANSITFTWQDGDFRALSRLSDYSFEAVEADREGNIEYFRGRWVLTLSIRTEMADADIVVPRISEVVVETATDIGGDQVENETKIITEE